MQWQRDGSPDMSTVETSPLVTPWHFTDLRLEVPGAKAPDRTSDIYELYIHVLHRDILPRTSCQDAGIQAFYTEYPATLSKTR